jgi:hypothetical protein
MSIQTLSIIWNTISIEVMYNDDWSKAYRETYGYGMAQLEIRSQDKQRLPMTETGYRSHFTPAPDINDHGGAEKFVRDWLDHEAQSRAWKAYVKHSRQLSLFYSLPSHRLRRHNL